MKKRILLISYFFKPYKAVGAARLTYWAENLAQFNYDVEVITATQQNNISHDNIRVHFVENKDKNAFVADPGISWKKEIKKYISEYINEKFDFVIISGGPFMHFGLSTFLKDKLNCKVVLDFRDPFANNERFNDSFITGHIKNYFEKQFVKKSDAVISVNPQILNKLVSKIKKPHAVIPNGYDERYIPESKNIKFDNTKYHLVYAGKFYDGSKPTTLIKVLNEQFDNQVKFHYLGQDGKDLSALSPSILAKYGMVEYNKAIEVINSCDLGIILTEGKEFETLTKPFDYMACNLKILVISEGDQKAGALYELTKDYPNIFWCRNTEHEIKAELIKALDSETESFNSDRFARRNGLENLVAFLDEI